MLIVGKPKGRILLYEFNYWALFLGLFSYGIIHKYLWGNDQTIGSAYF